MVRFYIIKTNKKLDFFDKFVKKLLIRNFKNIKRIYFTNMFYFETK